MSNVVYQLTVEDVSHFLTNKEHLNEVVRRIQKDFSCMEEMSTLFKEWKNSCIWKAKRVKRS